MLSDAQVAGLYFMLILALLVSVALMARGGRSKQQPKPEEPKQQENMSAISTGSGSSQAPLLVSVMPKEVYIFKRHGDMLLPLKAKLSRDGRMLFTKNGEAYLIPDGYKPKIYLRKKWRGYRAVLVFLADSDGKLVQWESNGVQAATPDPVFINRVINSRIIEKLAGATMIRATDILSWLLAGLGLAFILVFIVFPILGIDVSIGHIEVNVPPPQVVIQHQPQTPPPGNYTINP